MSILAGGGKRYVVGIGTLRRYPQAVGYEIRIAAVKKDKRVRLSI